MQTASAFFPMVPQSISFQIPGNEKKIGHEFLIYLRYCRMIPTSDTGVKFSSQNGLTVGRLDTPGVSGTTASGVPYTVASVLGAPLLQAIGQVPSRLSARARA